MTTTLSPAPNLEQIKKQSKELLRAFRAKDPLAAERLLQNHPEFQGLSNDSVSRRPVQLADAQLVVAREYGFASWPKLKAEVDRINLEAGKPASQKSRVRRENGRVWIEGVKNLAWGRDRENTFCGALEQALAATDHPYSYSDLMGFSGLAFRTRWFQGNGALDVCPSSPVGEFPEEIKAVIRATGWPIWTGNRLGEDDDKSMAPYWQEVVSSVDEGRPMLAYNQSMDVGIIHGYIEEGQRVLGWDYSHPGEEPLDMPIEKMNPWIGFFDENEGPQDAKEAFLESLRIAVQNFRRDTFDTARPRGDYRHGAIALSSWANDISQASPDQGEYYGRLFFVSWWTFNSLFDARITAPAFLREHADLFGEEPAALVRQAANLYGEEIELLVRTFRERDVFLGPWTGKKIEDWTEEVRRCEHDLLLEAMRIEEKAISLLDTALGGTTPVAGGPSC
jgi:hypothetical protein